jgi:hypothetical protein
MGASQKAMDTLFNDWKQYINEDEEYAISW